jgi:hypothetical protein
MATAKPKSKPAPAKKPAKPQPGSMRAYVRKRSY